MTTTQEEASAATTDCIRIVAEYIRPFFPDHANGIISEVSGKRANENSWHRISMILLSLRAVPGIFLVADEHNARNIGLSAALVTDKMAGTCFGSKDPAWDREFIVWLAADICSRIARHNKIES